MTDKKCHQFVSTSKEVIAETEVGAPSLTTMLYVKKECAGTLTAERDTQKLANFMLEVVAVGGTKNVPMYTTN